MIKNFLPLLVFLATACQNNDVSKDNEPNLRTLSAAENQVSKGSNQFAFNIFKKIQLEEPENTFISPLSISTALAMTLNGADTETQQSILNTINYGNFSVAEVNQGYKDITSLLTSMDNRVELGLANSVWHSNKFVAEKEFSTIIEDSFEGTVQSLDFNNKEESKQTINSWVEQKTHDRIKNLIDEISDDQAMFLVNAIYFKGDWTYQFDKSKTVNAPFFTPTGQTTAALMFSEGVKMNLYSNSQLQLVDIPYGNEQFSLTVVMPHEPSNLKTVISQLNAENFSDWLNQATEVTLPLELPKFKLDWKMDLKTKLKELGMRMYGFPKLFEEDLDLEVSAVLHQSFIEVNEEGSEAAAATAVSVTVLSSAQPPQKITLDKSFVFLIRERQSGVILFIGQVVDPAKL